MNIQIIEGYRLDFHVAHRILMFLLPYKVRGMFFLPPPYKANGSTIQQFTNMARIIPDFEDLFLRFRI